MSVEGQGKFLSPQNTSGVSQEKDVTVISHTIAENSDQVSNINKYIIKP